MSNNLERRNFLKPHKYQIEARDRAISSNIIINIRTGGGKTYVAVLVIDYFLLHQPEKRILFVVPSRALVSQQAEYIRTHCQHINGMNVSVTEISGSTSDSWSKSKWLSVMSEFQVIVGMSIVLIS
jgi:ERCC4-related helicase